MAKFALIYTKVKHFGNIFRQNVIIVDDWIGGYKRLLFDSLYFFESSIIVLYSRCSDFGVIGSTFSGHKVFVGFKFFELDSLPNVHNVSYWSWLSRDLFNCGYHDLVVWDSLMVETKLPLHKILGCN